MCKRIIILFCFIILHLFGQFSQENKCKDTIINFQGLNTYPLDVIKTLPLPEVADISFTHQIIKGTMPIKKLHPSGDKMPIKKPPKNLKFHILIKRPYFSLNNED